MATGKRYVCIHGHFYQPPRENPWLETVETQDSAAPYHDWNERISAECYAPNGAARIVNNQNQIIRIVNNYARMSFNFGPTLLSWLQGERAAHLPHDPRRRAPQPQALQRPRLRHGAGLQPHHHAAGQPARRASPRSAGASPTYQSRFGRSPKACGSPRPPSIPTALDLMAQEGIKFTILAPHQCERIRSLKNGADGQRRIGWTDTPDATVDTTRPYLVRFDSGAPSPSSSTTAPPRAPSPLKAC